MQTRVSIEGQIVLPEKLRQRLGIRAGDLLDVSTADDAGAEKIVLTPERPLPYEVRMITDTITGLPVLSAGPDAPMMTSAEVEAILADFP